MFRKVSVLVFGFSTALASGLFADSNTPTGACTNHLADAAQKIKAMKNNGDTTSFLLYAGVDKVSRVTFGVPFWVRTVKARSRVFRRYMDEEFLSEVCDRAQLKAGHCPYVKKSGPYREEFPDLVGIFMTTRTYSSESVGLETGMPSIDFTLAPETELFMLEPGIYLIPTESMVAPILRKIHESGSDELARLKKDLRAAERKERAFRNQIRIPINIINIDR